MKVSELSGAMLDYWVAKAEGIPVYICGENWPGNGAVFAESFERAVATVGLQGIQAGVFIERHGKASEWSPSQAWGHGGPIIERELIRLQPTHEGWSAQIFVDAGGLFPVYGYGSTPLIATMRAYVASKFGEEVPAHPAAQQEEG